MDYADNDGPLLLAEDTAIGLSFNNGKVSVAEEPGLGICLRTN
jgi:L-Ala-D/L-Glu epimerase / N-acetyl-D-glutamate racemase